MRSRRLPIVLVSSSRRGASALGDHSCSPKCPLDRLLERTERTPQLAHVFR